MKTFLVVLGLTLTLGMTSACGEGLRGGDTTCGEFRSMSKSDQTRVIKDFGRKGESDVSNFEIGRNRLSAKAFCNTVGSDSSKIREIDG